MGKNHASQYANFGSLLPAGTRLKGATLKLETYEISLYYNNKLHFMNKIIIYIHLNSFLTTPNFFHAQDSSH